MKKKKGNSLIIVIAIFAILFTAGTSLLTMTASDYKSRVIETKRIENLYGADAGIDTAYSIAGNVVKKAVEEGNKQAESTIDGINTIISSEIQKMKNNQQCAYPRSGTPNKSKLVNDDYTINEDGVKVEFLNTTFKTSYKTIIESELIKCIKEKKKIDSYVAGTFQYSNVTFNTNDGKVIDFNDSKIETLDNSNNPATGNAISKYRLTITSKYEDSSSSNGIRKVTAIYYISIPNYSGNYGIKSESTIVNTSGVTIKSLTLKPIVADGDLAIDSVSGFNISGSIFIKGNENSGSGSIAYSKYSGGISINNVYGGQFVNGDVVTARTLRLINSAKGIDINDGNLYSNNIYLGKDEGGIADSLGLQIRKLAIIDNDLTMNATKSTVTIDQGLYAISDINRTSYAKKDAKEKSSSSIILNDFDNDSKISVNNRAYIMGTAYINTSEAYQTGESVAIKGNYKAYATILPEDGVGYFYKYYNPLTLIDKNNVTVVDKAAHFYNYATNAQYSSGIAVTNNIHLPNNTNETISTGAYISDGTVHKANYTLDGSFQSDLNNKRRLFAQQVYEMGSIPLSDTTKLDDSYNNGVVNKTVANILNMPNNQSSIDYSDNVNIDDGSKYTIVINTNPNKKIFIKGNAPTFSVTPNTSGTNSDIVIDRKNSQILNAIIISAGDVYISGDITYKGSIITEKNVRIEGKNKSGNISIKTDPIVSDIYAAYKAKIENLAQTETTSKMVTSTTVKNTVNLDDIIRKGRWSIDK